MRVRQAQSVYPAEVKKISNVGQGLVPLPPLVSFLMANYDTVSLGKVAKTWPWRKVRVITVNMQLLRWKNIEAEN